MVKTAILVSGGGANLQALIDARIFGELKNCELSAVISSSPDAYALTRAERAGIPAYIVDADVFPNGVTFCSALLDKLRDLDIELAVLAGWEAALDPRVVKHYKNRIISVHPSLMPVFSGEGADGQRAHELALSHGVKVTGATAYFVTGETAEGPIIAQKVVEVLEDDTPASLGRRVMEQAEWTILPKAVSLFCEGRLTVDGDIVKIAPERT